MIEETMPDYDISSHFIYSIAKFLVMLSHDTLHSKQTLQFLTIIVDSVRHEGDKWKMFFTTNFRCTSCSFTITCYSTGLSKGQSLLDIYSTQVILFDVVSSFELRPIDPFVVASRASTNINVDPILTRWNNALSSVNRIRDSGYVFDMILFII
ncbi:unnamed protein product [Rotaria sordida]|uniref:Uncharacterized protein n=1 Tax=Rotaria sordida TaxID=392033 RepID=A0A814TB25_9BILA|nr:unnamed protein product [Rotaria sordida]